MQLIFTVLKNNGRDILLASIGCAISALLGGTTAEQAIESVIRLKITHGFGLFLSVFLLSGIIFTTMYTVLAASAVLFKGPSIKREFDTIIARYVDEEMQGDSLADYYSDKKTVKINDFRRDMAKYNKNLLRHLLTNLEKELENSKAIKGTAIRASIYTYTKSDNDQKFMSGFCKGLHSKIDNFPNIDYEIIDGLNSEHDLSGKGFATACASYTPTIMGSPALKISNHRNIFSANPNDKTAGSKSYWCMRLHAPVEGTEKAVGVLSIDSDSPKDFFEWRRLRNNRLKNFEKEIQPFKKMLEYYLKDSYNAT